MEKIISNKHLKVYYPYWTMGIAYICMKLKQWRL